MKRYPIWMREIPKEGKMDLAGTQARIGAERGLRVDLLELI
jgi:hypothetical protein